MGCALRTRGQGRRFISAELRQNTVFARAIAIALAPLFGKGDSKFEPQSLNLNAPTLFSMGGIAAMP